MSKIRGPLLSTLGSGYAGLGKAHDELEPCVEERSADLQRSNERLETALTEIKTLSGFIPIYASCKKVRDDTGYWNQIEVYIRDRSDAQFSHGICPDCVKKLYPSVECDDAP